MPYMIKFNEDYPDPALAGLELELYRVRRDAGTGQYVRDSENGTYWGYDHPTETKTNPIASAGWMGTPRLGAQEEGYEICEVNREYENLEELLSDIEGEVAFFPGLTVTITEEVPDDEG